MDKLSKQAAEAFSSGAQPKTEPPVFTENLAPAKAWDAYLDEKTPAISWPASALEAFADCSPGRAEAVPGSGRYADLRR